ncbi:MAG: autotransporter-associated beta strand repeat-containing protein, partial [Candidatus Dormibacteraceae bacterium]
PKTSQALVQVQIVDNSKLFIWAGAADNDNWSTVTNWGSGLPGDGSKLVFRGNRQQTNHNDLLVRAGQVTLNNGGFRISGNPLTMMAGIVNNGDNVWAIDSTLFQPQTFSDLSGTLVVSGALNTDGHMLTALVNSNMLFSGVISGSGGFTKLGPGALVLAAPNTYTGPTVLRGGIVALSNSASISASSVIVLTNGTELDLRRDTSDFIVPAEQTLTGSGALIGPVVVQGTLAPTNGVLAFKDRLTLAGNTVLYVNIDTVVINPGIASSISVAAGLVYGGCLTVITNGDASLPSMPAGKVFQLFRKDPSAPSFEASGSFTRFNLPALKPGLRWDTSRLTTDGAIAVAYDIPQIVPIALTNGTLTIQFATFQGWLYAVESTTSLAPSAKWLPLYSRAGTGDTTTFSLPASATTPARFFRVRMY